MSEEPKREFRARIIRTDDGGMSITIECSSETIKHPDGRQDVTIHAPSLGLISEFLETNKTRRQN